MNMVLNLPIYCRLHVPSHKGLGNGQSCYEKKVLTAMVKSTNINKTSNSVNTKKTTIRDVRNPSSGLGHTLLKRAGLNR